MEYNLNPIARALGKQPAEFTKADLIHYIVSNDIHALNFRYTAADGRLKELNFVLQDVVSTARASSPASWRRAPPTSTWYLSSPRPS